MTRAAKLVRTKRHAGAVFQVPGFPEGIGPELELAPMGELLCLPMFHRAPWKVFLKKASAYQRSLAERAPIRGGRRYVYVDCCVQFLQPGVSALGARGGYAPNDWHIDGIARIGDEPSIFHAFTSECSVQTEFNANPLALDVADDGIAAINARLGRNRPKLPLVPRAMPAGRFVTFTEHVHRAAVPKQRELRFFFRITESSLMPPNPSARAVIRRSVVHAAKGSGRVLSSITQEDDRIVIHLPR